MGEVGAGAGTGQKRQAMSETRCDPALDLTDKTPSRGYVAMILARELEDQCDPAADESWDLWRACDLAHQREKDDSSWTITVTQGHGDSRWNIQRLLRYRQIVLTGERWQKFLAEEVKLAYRKLRTRELY